MLLLVGVGVYVDVALVTSPSVARYWVYIGASTHQQPNADDRSAVSRTWVIPTVQAKL